MASVTIPLFGSDNARLTGATTKDQSFTNAFPVVIPNSITGNNSYYLEKRFGWFRRIGGQYENGYFNTDIIGDKSGTSFYSSWLSASTGISVLDNSGGIDLGSWGGLSGRMTLTSILGVDHLAFILGGAIYYYSSSFSGATTFTGNTSNGLATVTNIPSTSTFIVGQSISGTGIQSDTRILSIDSSTQITMTLPATATNTGVTITREKLAKVIDSDISSNNFVGRPAFMDGYMFAIDSRGRLYQSALNNFTSWGAADYIQTNAGEGNSVSGRSIEVINKQIVAYCGNSIDILDNTGNPSGSVLSSMKINVGVGLSGGTINSSYYISKINDTIGWVYGQSFYVMGADFSPKKVSTNAVEKRLGYYFSLSTRSARVVAFTRNKYTYFAISISSFPSTAEADTSTDAVICYCLELDCWFNLSGEYFHTVFQASDGNILYSASSTTSEGRVFINSDVNSSLGTSTPETSYQDNQSTFSMIVRTSRTDFGSENIKTIKNVALMGSDIQSSGTATLEYSDNDYTTWTTAGTFDLTTINPKIHRVGSFRGGRAWRLTHSVNTAFRAQALKFEYEVGQH